MDKDSRDNCDLMRFMQLSDILLCPDCFAKLSVSDCSESLQCDKCKRDFVMLSSQLMDLMPLKFIPVEDEITKQSLSSIEFYRKCHQNKFVLNNNVSGWGDLSKAPRGYADFVLKETFFIESMLKNYGFSGLLMDIGGGVGNHSIHLSKLAKFVLCSDIDNNNINSALKSAMLKNVDNIFIIKSDYIRLPIQNESIDAVIAIDFLERGIAHDLLILKNIYRILKSGGHAIVDLHNRHEIFKFRRNRKIKEYTFKEAIDLIKLAGIIKFDITPFGYFPPNKTGRFYLALDHLFSRIPFAGKQCVRWLVHFSKP